MSGITEDRNLSNSCEPRMRIITSKNLKTWKRFVIFVVGHMSISCGHDWFESMTGLWASCCRCVGCVKKCWHDDKVMQ